MTISHPKEHISQTAATIIPEVVLQKCLDRPRGSVLLSRIYSVPSGWETEELKSAQDLYVVSTEEALKAAFKTPEQRKILLLKSASVTLDILKQQLETIGNTKTIFIEE